MKLLTGETNTPNFIRAIMTSNTNRKIDHLPIISDQPCNNCGECCRHGGQCWLRPLGHHGEGAPSIWWQGTCEFLIDQPDGTTLCQKLLDATPGIRQLILKGECEWDQFRKDIISNTQGDDSLRH